MARNWSDGPQTGYFYNPGAMYQGLFYAHDPRRDLFLSGYIREVAEVAQTTVLTVTWGADADVIGFTFDGLTIPAEALTDDDTSAAAVQTAIDAYITANPSGVLASTAILANAVTVTYADFVSHVDAGFSSGTSTVVAAPGATAASYARLTYGLGVSLDAGADFSVNGPYLRTIAAASSGTDVLLGVLGLMPGAMNSAFTVEAAGFDPAFLLPSKAYELVSKGSVIVPWVGTLPTAAGDQVFWINDPVAADDLGKFRSDTGAGGVEADQVSGFVEGLIPESNLVKVKFDL